MQQDLSESREDFLKEVERMNAKLGNKPISFERRVTGGEPVGMTGIFNESDMGKVVTKTCETHGEYSATCVYSSGNLKIFSSCPECRAIEKQNEQVIHDQELAEKQQREFEKRQQRINQLAGVAGIPRFFAKKNFDAYVANSERERDAKAWFYEFAEELKHKRDTGRFLVGFGTTGTGKTHLAIATALHVIESRTVLYLCAGDVIRAIRETWHKASEKTETQVINELVAVDLLVIDEIGVQFGTESEQNQLFEIVNKRILAEKNTILLTNLRLTSKKHDEKTLESLLGARVFDRLKEVADSVCFDWSSHRGG